MIPKRLLTFILQAAVVIIGVFIFSFFDPFSIFNSKKLKMRDTPTVVAEIKAMGKLITAEYYGEVIQSSGNAIYEQIAGLKVEHLARLQNMNDKLLSALDQAKKYAADNKRKTNDRWQIYKLFKERAPDILDDPDYDVLISIIEENTGRQERFIIMKLFEDGKMELKAKGKEPVPTIDKLIENYVAKQYDPSKGQQRWISNHEIILVGRGSVKAGIDFSNFDTKHMDYFADRNLVRLYFHQPEIISATINPWFIPEKQIKGFEYIFVGNRVNDGDDPKAVEISTQLKRECLGILENDARNAGIIEHARENAEATLTALFSLILDKQITVEIYGSPLEAHLNFLLSKKKLEGRDIVLIDSIAGKYLRTDTLDTFNFVTELYDSLVKEKTMPEPWHDANRSLDVSAFYYLISEDYFLSKHEQDSMKYVLADTTVSLKDWVYYPLGDRDLREKLWNIKFDVDQLPDSIHTKVKATRRDNLGHLEMKIGSLRKEPDSN